MIRLRKDDLVKVVAGGNKGKIGKVTKIIGDEVWVEGVNMRERHIRPSRVNPRGGKKEVQLPINASNLALIVDGKEKTGRIGYKVSAEGKKARVVKSTGKELK